MNTYTKNLLKFALAFAFLYPAVAGIINPINWVGFLPDFATSLSPFGAVKTLLIFEVIQIALALAILFLKKSVWPFIIAGLMLLGIVIFNWNSLDIVFRDISLFFVALSLAFEEYRQKKNILEVNN